MVNVLRTAFVEAAALILYLQSVIGGIGCGEGFRVNWKQTLVVSVTTLKNQVSRLLKTTQIH